MLRRVKQKPAPPSFVFTITEIYMKKRSDKNSKTSAVGIMVENKHGTQIPNLRISVIDTLELRQLAVIRSMSLNQTAHDPRTINGTAKVESEARTALKDVCVAGLIAQPIN